MSVNHYENFPVASFLLPANLRPAVAAIYAFARSADDIADEGDATAGERLSGLQSYEAELDLIANKETSNHPQFQDLARVIEKYALPLQAFRDLLSAFSQDVVTKRYETYADVLDYCRRSANPIGRLMLHLYGKVEAKGFQEADAICSALQLINFWQDVEVDWRKDRVYLPQEDLRRFGVTENQIAKGTLDDAWRNLMQFEVHRARNLMLSGATLPLHLPGRIGWELRLVVQGGLRILEKIEAADYDVFRRRPMLNKLDWLRLAARSMRMG
ncbi:MAG: squalene synthase HpnC [Burkholderiales bacterium]|nr:squalene synthase HpnC [Burkholderiales bacterium]